MIQIYLDKDTWKWIPFVNGDLKPYAIVSLMTEDDAKKECENKNRGKYESKN